MTLISFLCFIKSAYAGTGTANDINTLIIILIIFLVLFLAIPYVIKNVRRYLLKRLQNGNEINESTSKDFEVYDDFD